MPIHGYPGNVITANPTSPTVSSASGVWTTEQQLINQSAGRWPMAATQISRSLRFNSADSAYLNRTPASASNRRTWTWSGWVKKSVIAGDYPPLFNAGQSAPDTVLRFSDTDTISAILENGGGGNSQLVTTQVFRDPSAWYHIVWAVDTTQATANDRQRLYVNGVEVTAFGTRTNPTQNFDTNVNNTVQHRIGGQRYASYYNGYMTEINFIDGQALTPSYFGFNDSNTGVWTPRQYTGAYGTNGFYVNFSDNSGTTSTTLGKDSSGNGNNWTPNNFSVTAGAGNDSLVDSPTAYGTDTGVGGTVRGNYATLNPLRNHSSNTLSNGNLDIISTDAASSRTTFATIGVTSGKWYWEHTVTATDSGSTYYPGFGVNTDLSLLPSGQSGDTASGYMYLKNGQKYNSGSLTAYGASYTTNDVIGVALDMDAGTITFYKNGSSQGQAFSGITGTAVSCVVGAKGTNNVASLVNFGQRAFAYTAPSGFKALCTQNLPTPTIGATSTTQANDYFNPVLYTGNGDSSSTGITNSISGVGFQPDFIWIKGRSNSRPHHLVDAVRGIGTDRYRSLQTNTTDAEITSEVFGGVTGGVISINSDGFTVRSRNGWVGDDVNAGSEAFVAWNWKANGAGSSNTAGTITSTVSANTTSGFSIVTYTGTGANATVGHGLGVAPRMVIVKSRSYSPSAWRMYNSNLANAATTLDLNSTAAADGTNGTSFNSTAPTSTVFSLGTADNTNRSGSTYVAYCFAPVAGYSAFGSYTGNGSTDGPFVFTNFRPRFVMVKRTSGIEKWYMMDTARDTDNPIDITQLVANASDAEATFTAFDFTSNGFKNRTSNVMSNGNGDTYIYMAFAENPFKYALAR